MKIKPKKKEKKKKQKKYIRDNMRCSQAFKKDVASSPKKNSPYDEGTEGREVCTFCETAAPHAKGILSVILTFETGSRLIRSCDVCLKFGKLSWNLANTEYLFTGETLGV